jgi:alpha-glucosidase
MYYGEEIGMENNDPTRKEDVKDPQGITGWPKEKGRDGERTPMQWKGSTNAGFSQAKPWLPVPPSYKTHNVEAESQDPNSILQFYKSVLTLRHNSHALLDGKYIALNQDDPNVISYLRQYKDDTVLVAVNMSGSEQTVSFDLTAQGLAEPKAATLLTTMKTQPPTGPLAKIAMEPFSVYIAKVVGGGAMQAAQKLRLN